MKSLICAILCVIASACSTTNVVRNDSLDDSGRELVNYISDAIANGEMTDADALEALGYTENFEDNGAQYSKFFPLDDIAGIPISGVNTKDHWNCTEMPLFSFNIDCWESELTTTGCRIGFTISDPLSSMKGTWVFSKECNGKPIAVYTLYGLIVYYDTVMHVF